MRASIAPKMAEPIAPPKRSKIPKKPNISPALCCGTSEAKSDLESAWIPPITIAMTKAKAKNWAMLLRP